MTAQGDCFGFAVREAQKALKSTVADFKVVHGTAIHPWSKQSFEHAWIESDGEAYDWQMTEVRRTARVPIDKFYEIWKPSGVRKYSAEQAIKKALRYRHAGPW